MSRSNLRHLPSVEKVLARLESPPGVSRRTLTSLVRDEVEAMREELLAECEPLEFGEALDRIRCRAESFGKQRLQRVVNATGILVHTNLGRAPISSSALEAAAKLASGYSNLELDLNTGARGKRGASLERNLAVLCEAGAATVVNNCASALVLILRELANGDRNQVIIGRNQLVEIGGGFRVPEIMETSGAQLVEVGATNRVALDDYSNAICDQTGMLLKVHRSNFYMEGFVSEPATEELVELARRRDLPIVEDLGSGAMLPIEQLAPIPHEPTAAEVLAKGVDLVCVSGDKLLGGPQAGIIAGKPELIARLKKNPFFRALRCDKIVLTVLQETVREYLEAGERGERPDLPLLNMLSTPLEVLTARAKEIAHQCGDAINGNVTVEVGHGLARCGGGTMPKAEIPSVTLDLQSKDQAPPALLTKLREGQPPVIGYVSDDRVKLDLRTVAPDDDSSIVSALTALSQ